MNEKRLRSILKKNWLRFVVSALILIAIISSIYFFKMRATVGIGKGTETPTFSAGTPGGKEKSPGPYVPPEQMNTKIPSNEFPPLDPLDPKKYPNLTQDDLQIFEKSAPDLLAKRRLVSHNPYKLLEALNLKEGDNIADIGCGTGYYTFILAYRVGKKRVSKMSGMTIVEPIDKNRGIVYAVDMSESMIKYLKYTIDDIKETKKVDFRNIILICNAKDPNSLGIPQNALDFAFLSETHLYNHIPGNVSHKITEEQRRNKEKYFNQIYKDTAKFTDEVYRSLKPGGFYVITENDITDRETESILFKDDVVRLLESTGKFKLEKSSDIFLESYLLFMRKI